MKNRYFFLFAPVTSGSTFLTKILNLFENTLGIPDALFEFFKFIIQKKNKKKISNKIKIESVYFSKNSTNYLQNCKNINLNKKVKKKDLEVIKDRIIHNSYFTPEFSNKLKSLSGKNYKIVFFLKLSNLISLKIALIAFSKLENFFNIILFFKSAINFLLFFP